MAGITSLAIGDTGAQLVSKFNGNFAIHPKVYNVVDYGAVHDGATDDTVAIQAAINACNTAGGGVVFLPNGVYEIAGVLQTDVGGLDYNSQLYIPAVATNATSRSAIRIIGETPPPYTARRNASQLITKGVVLQSNIVGSGVFPSVIGSVGATGATGDLNYNDIHLENIIISVDGAGENGITMCGVNFIRVSHCYINNVLVTQHGIASTSVIQPTAKVFGIGLGFYLDDFPRIGRACVNAGFYYGFVLGEGVHAQNISSFRNYIGIMLLTQSHETLIDCATLHWNTYNIAAQDATIYGKVVGTTRLRINGCSIETDEDPAWTHLTAMVLDSSNYLIGSAKFNCNATLPITKTGGRNFFIMNTVKTGEIPQWADGTQPTVPVLGCIGWNATTSKLEMYNGSAWVDLN